VAEESRGAAVGGGGAEGEEDGCVGLGGCVVDAYMGWLST
jgi:hypothetical protein